MRKEDKIETLQAAQEMILEAIEMISQAVGDDPHTDVYLIAPLKIHASSGHGYMTSDLNIDQVINEIEMTIVD